MFVTIDYPKPNGVIQQGDLTIKGQANPNAEVSFSLQHLGNTLESQQVIADGQGNWRNKLPISLLPGAFAVSAWPYSEKGKGPIRPGQDIIEPPSAHVTFSVV
jgi:hypothetical protein